MSFLHVQLSQEEREEIRENDGYLRGREDGYISGKEEGVCIGVKKGIIDVAIKMKSSGMSKDQITQLTGLDVDEIEKL